MENVYKSTIKGFEKSDANVNANLKALKAFQQVEDHQEYFSKLKKHQEAMKFD